MIKTRVGAVTKFLMAANDMVEAGHLVEMTAAGGRATHVKSGRTRDFHRRKGVFEAEVKVIPYACTKLVRQLASGSAALQASR